MRILQVVSLVDDDATCGGRLAVALSQCAELRRRGHDARLLAGWAGAQDPPPELEGVPAHLFRTKGFAGRGAGGFSMAMTAWLRRNAETFDVAHLHFARDLTQLTAAAVLDRAAVPYVVQTHESVRPANGRAARWVDDLFTLPALRHARRRLVADPAQLQVVAELTGSALGITQLGPGVALSDARPRTCGRDTLDVVFVGRLSAERGVMDVAEVARAGLALGLDARFTVIGPDGGERAALTRFIQDNPQLRGLLRYEGACSHERALDRLRRADLFLMPAQDGSTSMAVLEALAAGVPTVVTTGYSHAITLRARRAARVVRPTVPAITEAIRELAADPLARAELGRRGKIAAARAFDIGAVADELETVYAGAVHDPRPVVTQVPRDAPTTRDDRGDQQAGTVAVQPTRTSDDPAPDDISLDGARNLLWVTTEVTPYRLALWREVAQLSDLTVGLLAATQANWRLQLDSPAEPFTVVPLNAPAVPQSHGILLYAPTRALRALVRRGPDAVVLDGWESPAFHKAARWARRRGVPVVATYRATRAADPVVRAQNERSLRSLRRRVDAVFTANPEPDFFAPDAAASVAPERAVPASAAADRSAAASGATDRPGVPRQFGSGLVVDVRDGHRFLYVGELIGRKNVEGLLRAFHLARGLGDTLTVVGNGPLAPALAELAATLGVDDSVIFLGGDGDLRRRQPMSLGQTLVLPSTDEIWSGIVEEALSAGLHAVVSTACGISEHVRLHPRVLTAEPTPPALARAMVRSRQRWTDPRRPGLVTLHPRARAEPRQVAQARATP